MSLRDYLVERDKFQHGHDYSIYGFPCCVCEHRQYDAQKEPCRTCDHNANAVKDDTANASGEGRPHAAGKKE